MSNDDNTDTNDTLPESERIKPRTRMQRAKSYARGWIMAAVATAGAVAIGIANGVPMEDVGLFALGACLIDEPLTWFFYGFHDRSVAEQQEAVKDGRIEDAKKHHTVFAFIGLGALLFAMGIWAPLRWGAVFAVAMGWL